MRRTLSILLRIAAFATACGLSWFALVNDMFARGINRSYFHTDHVSVEWTDFLLVAVVVYLMFVTFTGRVVPWRRKRGSEA